MPISVGVVRARRERLEAIWLEEARNLIDERLVSAWNNGWIDVFLPFNFQTGYLVVLKMSYERLGWTVKSRLQRHTNGLGVVISLRKQNAWDRLLNHFRSY